MIQMERNAHATQVTNRFFFRSSKRNNSSNNPLTSSDCDLKRMGAGAGGGGVGSTRGGFTNPLQFVPQDKKLMIENVSCHCSMCNFGTGIMND